MSLAAKITALLASLSRNQIQAMPPAQRQQLANECLRVLQLALPPAPMPPVEGILARLNKGERSQ